MKAVVYEGKGKLEVENVEEPKLRNPSDAIIRLTASAICGSDLHFLRGTVPGMQPGTVMGHEGVGIVEELGQDVRNLQIGDRVIVPSTIACGNCSYCRTGCYAQCAVANPGSPEGWPMYFGGPGKDGPLHGLQAEYARIPFANFSPMRVPEELTDEQAIMCSDILPTAWFGARLAQVRNGDSVAVFGCGVVGQLAVVSALLQGAARVIAVDNRIDRLQSAQRLGAAVVNFDAEDPVAFIDHQTNGHGVDRVIDAVGVDAIQPQTGPAVADDVTAAEFNRERSAVVIEDGTTGGEWGTGDAPSQVLRWAVAALAKTGTLGIIGVYPSTLTSFPIGEAMMKNLTINAGLCNHRKYLPTVVDLVRSGSIDPTVVLSKEEPIDNAIDAYRQFGQRRFGWIKVKLEID